MTHVVIGMDPHKRSVTIEVMAPDESVLGGGRYATDEPGFTALLRDAQRWPERVWAVEGCSGIGHHVATRLLAQGEQVVDVPTQRGAMSGRWLYASTSLGGAEPAGAAWPSRAVSAARYETCPLAFSADQSAAQASA